MLGDGSADMTEGKVDGRVLDDLFEVIESRRDGNPETSHSARLLQAGPATIAQKVGEEAVETVIEGVAGSPETLIAESADLLYHLLVLWAARGVTPAQVWTALGRREGVSGLAEKASRERGRRP
jgi:phosphoribosyl-ATP pyrophosphohydrolase